MKATAILPVKRFEAAKQRLSTGMDDERRRDSAESENREGVEDVAANHVANGNVAGATGNGLDADGEFGRACAGGDDREANDERADPSDDRELRCAAHEELAPGYEKDKPGSKA